jgi:WD40 repeat protein
MPYLHHRIVLSIWNTERGEELNTLEGHTDEIDSVALTPEGSVAVSASWDISKEYIIKIWELESGGEYISHDLKGHKDIIKGVAISHDGQFAVSASLDGTLKVWNLHNNNELETLRGHLEGVIAVALSPDEKIIYSAAHDKTIKVWDICRGVEIGTLIGHTAAVRAISITLDGLNAISVSDDSTLKVWDSGGVYTYLIVPKDQAEPQANRLIELALEDIKRTQQDQEKEQAIA